MKRRAFPLLLCAAMLLLTLVGTGQAFPGLPSLPGLGGGAPEPWFATGLVDAVTDVPFLDVYDPAYRVPVQEMPRGLQGEFLLGPGAYDLWAESYCLTAGAHRPGAGHGDGYAYAPAKGKGGPIIQTILRNAPMHPEIPQHDIQVLLWALIAQSPFDELDPKLRQTAEVLLDKNGLDALRKAAQARQTAEILSQVAGYLPGPVQQILNAESTLRGMLSGALPGYGQIEAVAMALGEPGTHKGDREIVKGRWSYHPNGYFVSFFPESYTSTLVEIVNPGSLKVAVDRQGRVTRVSDQAGNGVEVVYESKAYSIPGESGMLICPFKTVRFKKVIPWKPEAPVVLELEGKGYALVGSPAGDTAPPAGQGALSTLPARFRWTVAHRKQMEALTASICKLHKQSADIKARTDMLPLLVNIGGFAQGLRETLIEVSGRDPKADVSLANPAYEAWQAAVVVFGESVKKPATGRENGFRRVASRDLLAGDWDNAPGPGPKWLKQWDPSKDVSQPGNQGRQRLGLSGRGRNDENRRPPGRRNDRKNPDPDSPDKDAWKNKDILVKARECMGWVEGIGNLGSAMDDAGQFAVGQAQSRVGIDFQGTVKDAMFDFIFESAGQISQSLGGDPPRPDFDQVTLPAPVDLTTVFQGMKKAPPSDGGLATALELESVLQAAQIARDRLGGAVNAGNAEGVYRQGMVLVELKRRAGLLWVRVADRLDALAERLEKAPNAGATPPAPQSGPAQGFTKADVEAAKRLGISSERLEAIRQQRLSRTAGTGGQPPAEALRQIAAAYRDLGCMWACLPAVPGLEGKAPR